jgi:signal transduction histidine kinase
VHHGQLSEVVAATLTAHASHLAQHWLERALAATPRRVAPVGAAVADAPGPGATAKHASAGALDAALGDAGAVGTAPSGADVTEPDPGHAEQVMHALAASVRSSQAASFVIAGNVEGAHATLGHVPQAQDARPVGEVMRLGWSAGRAAFAAGLSVHHIVRDADLLLAVVLADMERALDDAPVAGATAAEAFAVARRLHRAAGRYGQAAVSGFVHALLAELRERYRLLRHDLRNPLGTIRSALSLMEDESVPAETRHGPGIRAMVARNAGSLDHLIALGLDDAAATSLLSPAQEVGLREVALAARREVREAARLSGCEVAVDLPDVGPSRVDGAALELTLTAMLLAALARAAPGSTLHIAYADPAGADEDVAEVLQVSVEPPGSATDGGRDLPADSGTAWDEHGLRLALELARDHGARLGAEPAAARVRDVERLVEALAVAPTLYLRLPVTPPADRPAPAPDRR